MRLVHYRSFSTDLSGKVAVVTGSTSGIGLGVATGLARRGCRVMLNGFGDPSAALQQVQSVAKSKKYVSFFDADLSSGEGVEALIDASQKLLGGSVDILVNNAGIQSVHPIDSFPPEKWNAILNVNLSAAFHGIRLVLPEMKTKKWGRIINIASVHGLVASANKSAYVAAKHGIIGLTKVRLFLIRMRSNEFSKGCCTRGCSNSRCYLHCDLSWLGSDASG
jgi:3-hydroxybutyrate dehydrogenase